MGFSSAHMHKEKPIPISYSTLPPQNCEKGTPNKPLERAIPCLSFVGRDGDC